MIYRFQETTLWENMHDLGSTFQGHSRTTGRVANESSYDFLSIFYQNIYLIVSFILFHYSIVFSREQDTCQRADSSSARQKWRVCRADPGPRRPQGTVSLFNSVTSLLPKLYSHKSLKTAVVVGKFIIEMFLERMQPTECQCLLQASNLILGCWRELVPPPPQFN